MSETTKGFLIFAHNNEEIDYGKLALCCASMIKHHLINNNICLVSDRGTLDYLKTQYDDKTINSAFSHIVIVDDTFRDKSSMRKFQDTLSTSKPLTWYNGSRNSAYDITPFDETIILDSDVLIQDNMMDKVWGNYEDVLINSEAILLNGKKPNSNELRLESTSLKMFWATMLYFRKTERAKLLFDLVSYIKENYTYFQYVYEFPGNLYRNDYAFSIAIHMLNGFLENNEFKPFPQSTILSSFDVDELIDIDETGMLFMVSDNTHDWKFVLSRIKGLTVHCMNKYALLRQADKILDLYK